MRSIITLLCCLLLTGVMQHSIAQRVEDCRKDCPQAPSYPRHLNGIAPNDMSAGGDVMNIRCHGKNNGEIHVKIADIVGGVPPYTFYWYYGLAIMEINQDGKANGLEPGDYYLVIRDANNCCSSPYKYVVTDADAMYNAWTAFNPTPDVRGVTCAGSADGAARFRPVKNFTLGTGGTTSTYPYVVYFSNRANTYSRDSVVLTDVAFTESNGTFRPVKYEVVWDSLPAGEYVVLVKNTTIETACIEEFVFNVTTPQPLSVNVRVQNVDCGNQQNGQQRPGGIYLKINGGYQRTAVNKIVEIFDRDPNVFVNVPQPIYTTTVRAQDNFNNTIEHDMTGVAPFNFDTPEKTYWVRVREADHGLSNNPGKNVRCEVVQPFVVLKPEGVQINVFTNATSCHDSKDGNILMNIQGGRPPYTINWFRFTNPNLPVGHPLHVTEDVPNAKIDANGQVLQAGDNIPADDSTFLNRRNIGRGWYDVRVTDAYGCETVRNLLVPGPDSIQVQNVSVKQTSCQDYTNGGISFFVSGGTVITPLNQNGRYYRYEIRYDDGSDATLKNPPVTETVEREQNGIGVPTGRVRVNLGTILTPGNYRFVVYDKNNCTEIFNVHVDSDQGDLLAVDAEVEQPISCHGGSDGRILVKLPFGSHKAISRCELSTGQAVSSFDGISCNFSNLTAGFYTVKTYDGDGNALDCFVLDTITLRDPSPISFSTQITNVRCKGELTGEILVYNKSGGTESDKDGDWYNMKYCKLMNNQTGATRVCNGEPGFVGTVIRDSVLRNITAGTYLVQVIDDNGCITEPETLKVREPEAPLIVRIDIQRYAYCSVLNNSTPVQGYEGILQADIFDTPINGIPSGTPPYRFFWSLPPGIPPGNMPMPNDRGQVYSNLPGGQYTVRVVDANDCEAFATIELPVPTPISLSLVQIRSLIDCDPDSRALVEVIAGGGSRTDSGDPLYRPIPGSDNFIVSVDPEPSPQLEDYYHKDPITGRMYLELGNGTYTVTVRDQAGCRHSRNNLIILPDNTENAILGTIHLDGEDLAPKDQKEFTKLTRLDAAGNFIVSCHGATDGKVTIRPVGGRATQGNGFFEFEWYRVVEVNGKNQQIRLDGQHISSTALTTTAFNLAPGHYSLLIRDVPSGPPAGCVLLTSFNILEPTPLDITFNQKKVISCQNALDGVLTGTVTGGYLPYSYNWSSGQRLNTTYSKSMDIPSPLPGLYSLVVTDSLGCMVTDTVTIRQPDSLRVLDNSRNFPSDFAKIDVSCFGANNGQIYAFIEGGSQPYSLAWSSAVPGFNPTIFGNGSTNKNGVIDTLTKLAPGRYTLTVTDKNGCVTVKNYDINEYPVITITKTTPTTATQCGLNTGSVRVEITGGRRPHVYQLETLSGTVLFRNTRLDAFYTFANVAAGTYVVRVVDENYVNDPTETCRTFPTATVTVNDPARPHIQLVNSEGESCSNSNDGVARVRAFVSEGSTEICKTCIFGWYRVDNGVLVKETTDELVSTLDGGEYYAVAVNKTTNCRDTVRVTIDSPAPFTVDIDINQPTCFGKYENVVLYARTSGGVAPNSYQWTFGDLADFILVRYNKDSSAIRDHIPGIYTVSVRDAHGCLAIDRDTVIAPIPILTNVNLIKSATCNGGSDGTFDIVITGGWENYEVTVREINTNVAVSAFFYTEDDDLERISGLKAGTYRIIIRDYTIVNFNGRRDTVYGCIPYEEEFTTIPDGKLYYMSNSDVNIFSPTAPFGATINCTTKEATVTAKVWLDGRFVNTSEFTYNWGDGLGRQGNGPQQRIFTPSDLNFPNRHFLTITDHEGCSNTRQFKLLAEPKTTATPIPVSCKGENNGRLRVTTTNALNAYTYTIELGNGFTKSYITSQENIVLPPSNEAGLAPGFYTVQYTDGQGCSGEQIVQIRESDTPFEATLDFVRNVKCRGEKDAQAQISARGGVSPYSYRWYTVVVFSGGIDTLDLSTSATPDNLPAGRVYAEVWDGFGCKRNFTLNISEPATEHKIRASKTDVSSCVENNGTAHVDIEGANAPYVITWTKEGNAAFRVTNQRDITGLSTGVYNVQVVDINGCSRTAQVEVKGVNIEISTTISPLTCKDGNNARIDAKLNGNQPGIGFTVRWTRNGDLLPINTLVADNLTAGIYGITVNFDNGCVVSTNATVENPAGIDAAFIFDAQATDVTTCGGSDGSITLVINVGSLPQGVTVRDYTWMRVGDNLADAVTTSEPKVTGLKSGDYVVMINYFRNGNLCSYEHKLGPRFVNLDGEQYRRSFVSQPSQLAVQDAIQQITCHGERNGSISLNVVGSTGEVTYRWNNSGPNSTDVSGETSNTIENLGPGVYKGVATDVSGCFLICQVEIKEPKQLIEVAFTKKDVSCFGRNDGAVHIDVAGGTGGLVYSWTGPDGFVSSSNNLSGLVAGNYDLLATDANGCEYRKSVAVNGPAEIQITVNDLVKAGCNGEASGKVDVSVTGGTGNFTYRWSNGQTTQDIEGLSAGVYTIVVNDGNCEGSRAIEVARATPSGLPALLIEEQSVDTFTICVGGVVRIYAPDHDLDGNAISGYLWLTGDGTPIGNEGSAILEFSSDNAGSFELYCSALTPCGPVSSNHVTINVEAKFETPTVTYDDDTKTLSVNATEGRIQWFLVGEGGQDSLIVGATGTAYRPLVDGGYYAVVSGEGECNESLKSNVFDFTTSVLPALSVQKLTLYPNPTNSAVTVRGDWNAHTAVAVEVYNQLGQTVHSAAMTPDANGSVQVDLNGMAAGVYKVRVTVNGQYWLGSVLKQ